MTGYMELRKAHDTWKVTNACIGVSYNLALIRLLNCFMSLYNRAIPDYQIAG